ncbi:PAS domain S-box protein [bacterium]|nr:PAS domain S-box protein [bacterium]
MKKDSISIENTKSLLKKAQEIIDISPDLSLKYALLAQERASSEEKHVYFGVFNKILGECYYLLDELPLAKEYILRAKDYYYKHGELLPKLEVISLLAKLHIKKSETEKAVELYHEILLTSTTLKFSKGIVLALHEMATLYLQIGEYGLAREVLSTINEAELSDVSPQIQFKVYINKTQAAIKCNSTKGVEVFLQKSYELAQGFSDESSLKSCYENYYLYHKFINDLPNAFIYLEKFYQLSKNQSTNKSHSEIANILNQYEIDKKEQEINIIEEKRSALEEANNTIRKQKNFLETILDTIPNAVYYKDLQGNYLGYNKKWLDLFVGKSKQPNIRNIYNVLPTKHADALTQHDEELLFNKRLMKNEYKIELWDNKEHALVIYKDVFRDERGAIEGIIGVVNDITEYKNTFLEASKTTNFLTAIFDYAPIGICIFSDDGHIEKANNYLKNILLASQDASFSNILDFVLAEDLTDVVQQLKENLGNKEVATRELRLQAQNGMIIYAEISYSPVYNPVDNKTVNLAIIKDITDRKIYDETLLKSERKLRDANYAKDRFFSIIAHDLRGPIGNYREIFKLLATKKNIFSEEERSTLMSELYKSADHTFDLLENLLQWTRSQKNEIQMIPNYYSVYEIVSKTINSLITVLENKHITIENKINLTHVGFFDINMISTVVRNLVSNAIKFSHPKSKITLSSVIENDLILVSVRDYGVGIPSSKLDTLFDPKEITSTMGTCKEKGTGLGLVLCKNFVEMNHGSIWVDSIENEGTTFTFSIPLESLIRESH